MGRTGFVYIMTNKNRTTLYIGVTNDLCRRIYEHKNHLIKNSFSDKYNLEYCIYYEEFPFIDLAIKREKELKKWNRQKKDDLINKKNPGWKVLVTETGFLRETVPFSKQVDDLLNELQQNGEIPRCARNDGASVNNNEGGSSLALGMTAEPVGEKSIDIGGCAANVDATSFLAKPVIPSAARNLPLQDKPVIPSAARNLPLQDKPVIPSAARNLPLQDKPVIPSAARNLPRQDKPVIPSAARNLPLQETPVIPSAARNQPLQDKPVIPPAAKNLPLQETPVIPSEARNLPLQDKIVIPNETRNPKQQEKNQHDSI